MNAFAKIDKDAFFRFASSHPEQRFEFERGRIVQQMTGGTRDHMLITARFVAVLAGAFEFKGWFALPERGVETGPSVRYPDVVVEPGDENRSSLATSRPLVVVEVLSPSSTVNDIDVKPAEYTSLASLDAYIVASQDEAACLVWQRGADGRFPAEPREVTGLEAVIRLETRAGAADVPLAVIYRGLE